MSTRCVSVSLGCCNKAAETEWLINSRNRFLTILEAGNLRECWQPDQVLVKAFFQVADRQFLSFFCSDCQFLVESSHDGEQNERKSVLSCFPLRAPSPHLKPLPSWPNYPPKGPPLNTITLAGRISVYEFRGTQTSSPYHHSTLSWCSCFTKTQIMGNFGGDCSQLSSAVATQKFTFQIMHSSVALMTRLWLFSHHSPGIFRSCGGKLMTYHLRRTRVHPN